MKKYLDTKKKPTILLGRIERLLLSKKSDRDTSVLHPSEFTSKDWCPREGWFLLVGYLNEEPPSMRLASIYAEGHFIHEKWQRWAKEAGVLLEAEVPVVEPGYRVSGRADGLLLIDEEVLLWEIKSIGLGTLRVYDQPVDKGLAQSFRMISRPFPAHIRQAMFYAWVLRKKGHKIERMVFTYECKEDQAAKEFVVAYNEDYLEEVFRKLDILFPNRDGNLIPNPPECEFGESCPCRRFP